MDISATIVNTTIAYLHSIEGLDTKIIVPEFDSHTQAVGITAPVMAVGVNSFTVGEPMHQLGSDGRSSSLGKRPYEARVRIRIYVPFSGGAQKAFEMADWIHTVLMRSAFHYAVNSVEFETAKYDSQTESITLDTFYTVKGTLSA